jgi:hypothetical protein
MNRSTGKSFVQDFVRIPAKKKGPRSGFAAYARALRKYGIETDTLVARNGILFEKKPAAGGGTTETEVPADDDQNGMLFSAYPFLC